MKHFYQERNGSLKSDENRSSCRSSLCFIGVNLGFNLKPNSFSNDHCNLAPLSLMTLVSPHVFVVDLRREEPAHATHPPLHGPAPSH